LQNLREYILNFVIRRGPTGGGVAVAGLGRSVCAALPAAGHQGARNDTGGDDRTIETGREHLISSTRGSNADSLTAIMLVAHAGLLIQMV
jgi:hypothetical protein